MSMSEDQKTLLMLLAILAGMVLIFVPWVIVSVLAFKWIFG